MEQFVQYFVTQIDPEIIDTTRIGQAKIPCGIPLAERRTVIRLQCAVAGVRT